MASWPYSGSFELQPETLIFPVVSILFVAEDPVWDDGPLILV